MNILEVFITIFELLIVSYIYTSKVSQIANAKLLYQKKLIFLLNLKFQIPITKKNGIFDYDKLSNFSLNKDFHKPYSFNKNGLCIALISANRPFYMIDDLTLLLYYIQTYEPNLKYDLVWLDTGTENYPQLHQKLHQKFHFDKMLHLPTFSKDIQFEGIPRIYEHMINLCEKNDYVMFFEEDLRLIKNPRIGFIQKTLDILNIAPHSLMGLLFRHDMVKKGVQKALLLNVSNEIFNISCQMDRKYQFSNAAAIYRMSNIKELIANNIKNNVSNPLYEISMAVSAKQLGMFFGFVDFIDNCPKPVGECYGVFIHVGKISKRTGKRSRRR